MNSQWFIHENQRVIEVLASGTCGLKDFTSLVSRTTDMLKEKPDYSLRIDLENVQLATDEFPAAEFPTKPDNIIQELGRRIQWKLIVSEGSARIWKNWCRTVSTCATSHISIYESNKSADMVFTRKPKLQTPLL